MKPLFFLCLFGSSLVFGDAPYLTVKKSSPLVIARGQSAQAVVQLVIRPGVHIQANPASTPQLIPTKIEFTSPAGIEVGSPVYPPGKSYRLESSQSEIATYDGAVEIKVALTAAADAKPGKRTLEGRLRYQACNDKICFFPTTLPISLRIKIKK